MMDVGGCSLESRAADAAVAVVDCYQVLTRCGSRGSSCQHHKRACARDWCTSGRKESRRASARVGLEGVLVVLVVQQHWLMLGCRELHTLVGICQLGLQ